ncbi:MAG: Holliday junction resolvase RuvX [Parvibaculales bacterium]
MALIEIAKLDTVIEKQKKVLGLDLGSKTIGLALGDYIHSIATPIGTIKRSKFSKDAEVLSKIIKEHDIGALIIGLPVNMDGTEGARAQSTRAFVRNFLNIYDIPCAFWDERLSTKAAERILLEADCSRVKRAKNIDKMAASFLLQGALDYIKNNSSLPKENHEHIN